VCIEGNIKKELNAVNQISWFHPPSMCSKIKVYTFKAVLPFKFRKSNYYGRQSKGP